MKQKTLIFFLLLLLLPISIRGQEATENYPVSIALVGATNYTDADYLLKNLRRSSQIRGLTIAMESRGLIELKGSFHGSAESLIEEVRGLAQDRFAVEVQKPKGRPPSSSLTITLRKISQQVPPS